MQIFEVHFRSLILDLFWLTVSHVANKKCFLSYAILRLFLPFKSRNVGVCGNENSLTVNISKKSDTKQRVKKIAFKTSKKWPFKEDFSAEINELEYIVSLFCKVCCDSLSHREWSYIKRNKEEISKYGQFYRWCSIYLTVNVEEWLLDWCKKKSSGPFICTLKPTIFLN